MQDTIRQKVIGGNDTIKVHVAKDSLRTDTGKVVVLPRRSWQAAQEIGDTIQDGNRNLFSSYTFSDSSGMLIASSPSGKESFPWIFLKENKARQDSIRTAIVGSLKEGISVPPDKFHGDWIIPLVFFAALLLGVVRAAPGSTFVNMFRFLAMRGINENGSRDTGVLFQWQSTLLNLSSFISVSLFIYLLLKNFDVEIPGISNFVTWLICLGSVIVAVTIRHITCNITGNASDEPEIFREYIMGIYHVYRFGGIILLILSILILYTVFIPVKICFFAGIMLSALLYMLRVLRLFLIFIRRHVSILYFILYLCALEILPVVILVKYFTGLS